MDLESHATFAQLSGHAKPAWLRAIRTLPPIWLIAPASGEVFNGKGHNLEAPARLGLIPRLRSHNGKGLEG
jgi:hypothetical protein